MLLIKGAHVVDPQVGLDTVTDVLVEGARIARVGANIKTPEGAEVIDGTGKYLVPGLTDIHVHFRDPGYEYKETIETGSAAAAAGGFTDVATMPNTNPVTDTGEGVRYQIAKGDAAGLVHVRPIGACTRGENGEALAEIGDMVAEGACMFSDDGHGVQSAGMLRTVMDYVRQFDRAVACHCEVRSLTEHGMVNEGRVSTRLGIAGWPAAGEEIEIARDIELCRLTGCALHICHISTARGAELVRAAKAEGLPVTAEVCPHHLFLDEELLDETYNTNLKMNPPLRTPADTAALREGICDGTLDCVVTDHAPHALHEKECEFEIAPFGVVGLETSLPLMLTNLVSTGKMSWQRLVEVMCVNPRKVARLEAVKVEAGSPADLTLIDPTIKLEVTPELFCGKQHNSAFMGAKLTGRATDTVVAGKHVLKNCKLA
ncbi:MAG: dihydroorotase [Parolsenella sp.]|uniref:dihydroorotase n=1 Tax=Parolsenella sp. TaxID=2083006 RepID=UPI002A759A8D|nr:dihydroorotase [Parolsenella sp.]MCI5950653.1 dihydroorotase [Coriobacteriaceae bacterium]MDY3292636.1 dihydroorotase [Parolsenella sp.]